jgi:signal transduction histidine kinase
LAEQRHLFLRCDGPTGFAADGDPVKIRRIAQNLILNAVKFTREGGITVTWGDSETHDPKRWQLRIEDSGPGFHSSAGKPMAQALEVQPGSEVNGVSGARSEASRPVQNETGEGIGLSIVKRLCDMLDATIEMKSVANVGTTFRILFPRKYSS